MNSNNPNSIFIYLCFNLILIQSLGAQVPLHQKLLPSSSPGHQKLELLVLFSEIPAKNQPTHFYGAKGKVFMKVGKKVEVIGTLEHSYEIAFYAKKQPGVVGAIIFPISESSQIEIHAEISNRDGWKVSTIPLALNLKDLNSAEIPKPVNSWVSELPPLPKVSRCMGIIHNTLGSKPCPTGTVPTGWLEGLNCPCVCCVNPDDPKNH